jgi:hypothetical protein
MRYLAPNAVLPGLALVVQGADYGHDLPDPATPTNLTAVESNAPAFHKASFPLTPALSLGETRNPAIESSADQSEPRTFPPSTVSGLTFVAELYRRYTKP